MNSFDRHVKALTDAHRSELERRCRLIAKFVPVTWLSLRYNDRLLIAQPKIMANPPK